MIDAERRRVTWSVMTGLMALALPFAAGAAPDSRPALDPAELAAVRKVILAQQEAFRRDDGRAAYAFASPRLHTVFQTPESFMAMVRRNYAPVYRPRVFSFRPFAWIEGRPVQPVLVVGPDGIPVTALYLMERQGDGSWRIAGVVLVPEPNEPT
jgi:Domain of unknown function (DUF4864)